MTSPHVPGAVAVFDASVPPGVSFIRSLGRSGVRVHAFDPRPFAPGRFSRFSKSFDRCPEPYHTDDFVDWLEIEVDRGLTLVAPTSDYVSFVVAELEDRLGLDLSGGVGGARGAEAVRDCLFKHRFARRMNEIGFPTPSTATTTCVDEAVALAAEIGYPVVLKPRSHVGTGVGRGTIVYGEEDLRREFRPAELDPRQSVALRHDPDLAFPMLQQMIERNSVECISVTGCLDRDGNVMAAGCSRKIDQWGDTLAVGTLFEVCDQPPFFDHALDATRQMLGTGVFELEVLHDRETGEYWAIDLNPRGFGQMSLDVGRGNRLPLLWYRSATGLASPDPRPRVRAPRLWILGVPFAAGTAVRLVLGSGRRAYVRKLLSLLVQPRAAAMFWWADPMPGVMLAIWMLRHPGGLVKPYVKTVRAERARARVRDSGR